MQNSDSNPTCETQAIHDAGFRTHKMLPTLHLITSRAVARKIRVAIPVPRRESCLTKRTLLAALREAEFEEWMNSGGDFLDSMHQPVH